MSPLVSLLARPGTVRKWSAFLVALSVTAITTYLVQSASAPKRQQAQMVKSTGSASPVTPIPGVPVLDGDTREFNAQTNAVSHAHECFPLHLRDDRKIGILYLYCSDEALEKDGDSVKLTDTFTVTEGLARRYNFWRRIYSLWSKDQYVLHLSTWPEVVLEAYDASRMGEKHGPVAREVRIKKVARTQRVHYKRLFSKMHKYRKSPERFTPAMKRVARMMAHIPNDNKYWVAGRALRLQRGQRDFIAKGLAIAPKYLPAIQENFRELGIPVEVSLLAFVESSFNLNARSKVGASGVYQIMPATGRQYLKLYGGVDERNDPIKASRAAAKLLSLNYKILRSWPLAITAYNHGVGGVRKAVRKMGTNDLDTIIRGYYGRSFKFASKNFFTSYLGILATLSDANRHFPEVERPAPLQFTTLRLARATSLKTLRRDHGVDIGDIEELNPDIDDLVIRRRGTLPKGYVIKLPAKAGAKTEASIHPVKLVPES